ncbi:MAG: glutathione S-transferase family protein [Pseudomonadota bacterium]
MLTIHHLRIGRSVFTVWLAEELELEYDLKIYIRNEMNRSPDDLKALHPLGKSPIIEDEMDGKRVMLAESGAIASYLIDRYDTDHALSPPRSDVAAHAVWTQWLHYPEGSAFLPVMLQYIQLMMNGGTPPEPDGITQFSQTEIDTHFSYLNSILETQDYICGPSFQAPDVGLSFIMQMAEGLDKLAPYPALKAYLDRNRARPAFARAMEKSGG